MNAPVRHWDISCLEQLAHMSRWEAKTMVASIWGYFDESGEHAAADGKLIRLTLGGFYAPWPEIEVLCRRWREALEAEGLSDFHMKEIASDEHAYENWPSDRKTRLDRFVDILCDTAVSFGAFSYSAKSKKNLFSDAYQLGLGRVLIELENISIDNVTKGHVVFARSTQISQELIGRYFDQANWDNRLGGYSVMIAKDEPALQAAEIVARGMKQLMQDGLCTHSFQRLIATGKPFRFWPPDPPAAIPFHLRLGGRK